MRSKLLQRAAEALPESSVGTIPERGDVIPGSAKEIWRKSSAPPSFVISIKARKDAQGTAPKKKVLHDAHGSVVVFFFHQMDIIAPMKSYIAYILLSIGWLTGISSTPTAAKQKKKPLHTFQIFSSPPPAGSACWAPRSLSTSIRRPSR